MNLNRIKTKFSKKFGENSILLASDVRAYSRITYGVSSQSLLLDLVVGRPGFPAGRLTEIVGQTNVGKSALGYHVLAECQRMGGIGVLIETEQAYEDARLRRLGINTDDLWLLQPRNIEMALEMIETSMEEIRQVEKFTGPVVILLDSIAGTRSAVEEEGGFDERHMSAAARVITQGLRKLTIPLAQQKIVLIFLNQLRSTFAKYGEAYVSYGGSQIHKSSSVRIRLSSRQADLIKRGEQSIATWTQAYTIKNKLAMPFQLTKYLFNFETGIDPYEDLWRAALKLRVLTLKAKAFQLTMNGKSTAIERSKFEEFVMNKFKSPVKMREALTKIAIEKKVLKPYGGELSVSV